MFNWQGAVKVYMDALENPNSTPYARECAREDIMVIAKIVDTLKEKVNTFKALRPNSKMLIKEFPPNSITPPQLEAFIKKLGNKGFKPDIIVLDYLNLMAATYGNNSYERIKNISEQVRAMSYTF